MPSLSIKHLIIGLAMLSAAGLAIAMKPKPKPASEIQRLSLEAMIPKTFGGWAIDSSIAPIIPAPDVQANLDKIYDQILNRTYLDSTGRRVMLTITYGGQQTDQLKAHRQEVCYAAQGFQVNNVFQETLNLNGTTIPVTRMFAVKEQRNEPVTYWFTMGDKVVFSRLERLLVQLKYGITGEIPDGFLIRVSTIDSDPGHAYGDHLQFINDMISSMRQPDARLLIGSPI